MRPARPGPPIRLAPAPAHLRFVPDYLLRPAHPAQESRRASAVVRWLAAAGKPAPSLAEIEAERARRGMRRVEVREATP